jgi:hypothetical protein
LLFYLETLGLPPEEAALIDGEEEKPLCQCTEYVVILWRI